MAVKPKILFVDDDPLMHRLYRPHIERAGFELVSANDGSEAVRMAHDELPQFIVLDMIMPGEDGLAVMLKLKIKHSTKDIPIVAISADAQYHDLRAQLKGVGAESFLAKPFGPARLISEIRRLAGETGTQVERAPSEMCQRI